MSDWDKIQKEQPVPRNDPKISRDATYGNEISHNLELAKNVSRTLDIIESQDFRSNPIKVSTRKQRNTVRENYIQEQFQTRPKRKLRKRTPDDIENRRKIRQFIQEQKQQGRMDRHNFHTTAEHPAEKVLTWVFFFIMVGVASNIPGLFRGFKSIFVLVGGWYLARHYARRFLDKAQ